MKALEKAREAFRRDPSLYQAKLLEADCLINLGNGKRDRGEDAAAIADYEQGAQACRTAESIARSDPRCLDGLAELWVQRLKQDVSGRGGDIRVHFAEARQAAEAALRIDPDRAPAQQRLSLINLLMAQFLMRSGEDPTPLLEAASASAREAVRLPHSPLLNPSFQLAVAGQLQAMYNQAAGRDPRPALESAILAYEQVLRDFPRSTGATNNAGAACLSLAQYRISHGENPQNVLADAIRYLKMAEAIKPDQPDALANLAGAYILKGEYAQDHGQDPRPDLNEAVRLLDRAATLNPSFATAFVNQGEACMKLGDYEKSRGRDPSSHYAKAQTVLNRAIQAKPDLAVAHATLGEVCRAMAGYLRLTGQPDEVRLMNAGKHFSEAQAIDGGNVLSFVYAAAAILDGTGKSAIAPEPRLAAARNLLKKAKAVDPGQFEIHLQSGRADLLEARWRAGQRQNPEKMYQRACASFEKALAVNPYSTAAYLSLAELCGCRAEWQGAPENDGDIRQGLTRAEQALAINPQLAEARAAQGRLYLLQALREPEGDRRTAAVREATAAFERAFFINALLRHEYQAFFDQARSLMPR